VYDGQIHDSDLAERTARCEESFAAVLALEQTLENARLKVPALIAGGTPTFPVHAKDGRRQLSPGTCLLWDWGYSTKFPDLDFLVAATLLTRVISKPASNRLCLDLGHKAVASENPLPRLFIPALPEASHVMHSEEHLVVETHEAEKIPLGTPFLCIPRHICPSVALYSKAYLVRNRTLDGTWAIRGRERTLQF
jgi:D-serine deaminase-like pyridoxal phosphate-dependent protein